ncbi:MAG: transcriptional regulator GcvA [Rhodospirillaceae bacterium]|nr:transcriptional regulator GcvA [Rhodospirillaceae bacterium]
MADLPPLDALKVFDAAARRLSFAAAAEELHLTASAVSHRIKALEAQLGLPLFERMTRKVQLTPNGRAYAAAVADAIAILREATRRLGAEANRPLVVSVTPLFGSRWLLPRLARFEAAHPGLSVRLISSARLADFVRDGVDCAVRYGRGAWPGLVVHRLVTMDFVPVCAPGLLRRGARPLKRPADLKHHRLLHYESMPDAWRMWLLAAGAEGIDPDSGQVLSDMTAPIQAAMDGIGVAISDRKFIAQELKRGKLVAPFPLDIASGGAFYFVYPEGRSVDPRIATFRDWVLAEVARETA